MRPKNNPKNRRTLVEFQRRQLELSKETEADSRKRRIQANLENWEVNVSMPNAKPKNLGTLLEKVRKLPLSEPYGKFIVITSDNIKTSKFSAYAIIYGLIQKGQLAPSEVKETTLLEGYNNINGMFSSRKWKESIFNQKTKAVIINGASSELSFLANKGEEQFWRELLEFTQNQDKIVIINYKTNEDEKGKSCFIPELTTEKGLNAKIVKQSSYLFVTKEDKLND